MADGENTDGAPKDRLANLREPWKPGQSGNPGGAPKIVRDVAAAAREHTVQAIQTLVDALNAEKAPWAAKIKAAEVLLNRGYGQAPQTINLAGNVSTMTHEQLDRAIATQLGEYLAGRITPGTSGTDAGKIPAPVTIGPDGVVH